MDGITDAGEALMSPRRRRVRCLAAVAGTVIAVPLSAQSAGDPPPVARVEGVVFDSTRHRPLSGATVTLTSVRDSLVGHRVRSDASGRFRFEAVARGPWVAVAQHPRLDSLAIQELIAPVEVVGTRAQRVSLAVPGSGGLVERVCGPERRIGSGAVAEADAGFLRGRLRQAVTQQVVQQGVVRAEWIEDVLQNGRPSREVMSLTTAADGTGTFQLCGVPRQQSIRLIAVADQDSAGPLTLTLPADGVAYRDIFVGRGVSAVRGHVQDTYGRPVAEAQVGHAPSLQSVRTDSAGAFVLSRLPMGTSMLEVRALGYATHEHTVDLLDDASHTTVVLSRPELLDTLRVRAARSGRDARSAEFEARRRTGLGAYLGPAELARLNLLRVSDAFDVVPGVIRQYKGGQWVFTMRGTVGRCAPTILVDGVIMPRTAALDSFVPSADVLAIEIYSSPTKAPSQFTRTNRDCGVIVIWTGAMMADRRH